MGTITQSRPQLCSDNGRGSLSQIVLGSVIPLRAIALNNEGALYSAENRGRNVRCAKQRPGALCGSHRERGRRRGGLLGNKLQPTKDDELGGDLALLLPDCGLKKLLELVWLIANLSFILSKRKQELHQTFQK